MSTAPHPPPPHRSQRTPPGDEPPRDFRAVVAVYAVAPAVTHVAATVAAFSLGVDLGPLGNALLLGSTVTVVVLVLVGLFAFRR